MISAGVAAATTTQNLGIRVLPVPPSAGPGQAGAMVIDGKANDWDLSGGVLICADVETQRDAQSVWLHLMYDANNLYILARWKDDTPMQNPGSIASETDNAWNGDCLMFRSLTGAGTDQARCAHVACWRDKAGHDTVDLTYGTTFKEGRIRDAKAKDGAQQVFLADADGKGYTQEVSIPWKLLTRNGKAPQAGERFRFTAAMNFSKSDGRTEVADVVSLVGTAYPDREGYRGRQVRTGGRASRSLASGRVRCRCPDASAAVPRTAWKDHRNDAPRYRICC